LQHPHILPLLDSGDADGLLYYVMPLVTGETLRARLQRETQLPIKDAIIIAREVADALAYAHGLGVVHRDVKPENILLQGGHALVADFGIALAVQQAGGARMTQTGLSLGTPQYMSPEQAMGERNVDARSDVYALGAVTYEMLTGDPPFTGSSVQAIVAKVLTDRPAPISTTRDTVPLAMEQAVLRALAKLPADRFAGAAQFAEALVETGSTAETSYGSTPLAMPRRAVTWRRRFIAACGLAVVVAAVAAWGWLGPSRAKPTTEWQYIALSDASNGLTPLTAATQFAISPDGATTAFTSDSLGHLWLKRRAALAPVMLAGTEFANTPTFSPDGRWIAFVAGGVLKKVRVDGGATIQLADSVSLFGFAWLDDGSLVFTTASLLGLRRVSQDGGAVSVALPDSVFGGRGPLQPTALPEARGVLFTLCTSGCPVSSLHVLDLRTGKAHLLVENVNKGWYLPTGQLFYVRRDGVGVVAPFDLASLSITGSAVPLLEDIGLIGFVPQLAWSAAGTVLYGNGASGDLRTLQRSASNGAATLFDPTWVGKFGDFALSPDGRSVAVSTAGSGGTDIWIKRLDVGTFTRLTLTGRDRRPAWSPDGREVAFVRDSGATSDVYAHAVDGSGRERRLVHIEQPIQETVWMPDGRWILVRTDNNAAASADIIAISTTGDSARVMVASSPAVETEPAVSPDGRWIAYSSNETGNFEIYVRPFPGSAEARWPVSSGGGRSPAWSKDGRALYFIGTATRVMEAKVGVSAAFTVTSIKPFADASTFGYIGFHQVFQMSGDDELVYLAPPPMAAGQPHRLVRVDGWFGIIRDRLKN